MKSGLMFGTLQEVYSSGELLDDHSEIIVYMPDRELHYEVFAAVPFDNRHILYNYDMSDSRTFRLFFQEISSVKSLEAVFAEDTFIQSDEKALILSTCLKGNSNKRFLVCGKLSETIPDGALTDLSRRRLENRKVVLWKEIPVLLQPVL